MKLTYTKGVDNKDILVGDEQYQVMMEWEKPYMEALVDRLNPSGDVLEIGLGLGYSADAIQKYDINTHTIIECDTEVLKKLQEWAKKQKHKVFQLHKKKIKMMVMVVVIVVMVAMVVVGATVVVVDQAATDKREREQIKRIAEREAVRREAEDLQQSLAGSQLSGFLVQEMVDGLEMLVGVREDADFGPLVVVGLGGVFVELFRDVTLRLAPVDETEVRAMLSELRGAKALDGFRGQAPRDVDALVKAIIGVSDFYLKNRSWLAEIEINPLIVLADGKGVRAVDVRPIRRD